MEYANNGILLNLKKKEVLQYVTISINLEHIMPREVNHSQKDK